MVASIQHKHNAEVALHDLQAIALQHLADDDSIIAQAAALLEAGQPDRAALLLDGLAQSIAALWFGLLGEREPVPEMLLACLEERAPQLAWHLRLALRAPNVEARLVHCQQLIQFVAGAGSRH